jgi:hypothetical protein
MRDIRADLQERLDAIGRDREELKRRIADLEPLETAINAILMRERENFTAPISTNTERNFDNFPAEDAVGSFNSIEAGKSLGGKEVVVNYAPNDGLSGVKPAHWGGFRVS